MKITNLEYMTLTFILENRGYRYFDDDNYDPQESKIFKQVQTKILTTGKRDGIIRLTNEQRDFLEDLLIEYNEHNKPDAQESEDIKSLLRKIGSRYSLEYLEMIN